jgi:hypothetical protein
MRVTFVETNDNMMNRMKTYDVPHKGLRNGLSQLSVIAGKTDYSITHEVEQLYQFGLDVFSILTIHASDENEVTLAELETRCPGCSQHDVEDHEQIRQAQDNLEKQLAKIYTRSRSGEEVTQEGTEFYLALSEFHGKYLEHMAEEERVTQPLLWEHFTDDELASHRGRIMTKNPPKTLLTWFRFVIPAQSQTERTGLLAGFKKMAPVPFFNEAMEVIKQVLAIDEFDRLQSALGC